MKLILSLSIFLLLFATTASAAQAQVLKFELADPAATIPVGGSFQVKILIDTGGQDAINGDSLIIYDPAKLSVNSATSNNFFTYFSANPLGGTNNKYLVSSWEESIAHAKSSSTATPFATLNLTAQSAGTTTLTFECTPGTEADSNINRASDSTDMINCNGITPLTLNIGSTGPTTPPGGPTSTPPGGVIPTVTPIPSPTVIPTATPTRIPTSTPIPPPPTNPPPPQVTTLPRAGTTEITFAAIAVGVVLTVVGILIIL